MENKVGGRREVVEILEQEFARLLAGLASLTQTVPAELLYRRPRSAVLPVVTVGENILKSAALVEQVFGGLTSNLWDDPCEWTLPETLSNSDRIIEYLDEVNVGRQHGFACFTDDADLLKHVSVPSGESTRLLSLLLEALVRANEYQGRAVATLKLLADMGAPGFII
jgi:hypothetical protein